MNSSFRFYNKAVYQAFNLFGDQLKSNSLKLVQCWKKNVKGSVRDCLWKITRPEMTSYVVPRRYKHAATVVKFEVYSLFKL